MTHEHPHGRRILITGVSGMMGRALARRLAADNTVYGAARFTDAAVREHLEACGVRCVPMDLSARELPPLPQDVDTLLYFAVHWPGPHDAAVAMAVNGYAVGRLIERLGRLEQFVVGSSVAVYVGSGQREDLTEQSPTIPSGLYGTSRLAGDVLATHLAQSRGLSGAILRYWFPYTDEPGVANDYYQGVLGRLRRGEPFVLPRGRPGCQQPVFIDDVVRITLDSLRFASPEPFVLNVAGPERLTLRQIVDTLADVFGAQPNVELSDADESNLLSGSFDLTRLEQTCGAGKVRFADGLRRLAAARDAAHH